MTMQSDEPLAAIFEGFEADALKVVQEVPSAEVVAELRRIVTAMYSRWAAEYDVYAMDAHKAAVEIQQERGSGALLLVCEPGNQALCIVTKGSVSRRRRYQDSQVLPDGFVADGMHHLGIPER